MFRGNIFLVVICFHKGENMYDAKTIGKNIKQIRKSSEFNTQEKFAEFIEVSVETVSNIERGNVLLKTATLASIAEKCNVSTDSILGIEIN